MAIAPWDRGVVILQLDGSDVVAEGLWATIMLQSLLEQKHTDHDLPSLHTFLVITPL